MEVFWAAFAEVVLSSVGSTKSIGYLEAVVSFQSDASTSRRGGIPLTRDAIPKAHF